MPLKQILFKPDWLNQVVPVRESRNQSLVELFFEMNFLDPIPLVDSLNVLKSECSILEPKILRERFSKISTPSRLSKNLFLQFRQNFCKPGESQKRNRITNLSTDQYRKSALETVRYHQKKLCIRLA